MTEPNSSYSTPYNCKLSYKPDEINALLSPELDDIILFLVTMPGRIINEYTISW